jgi:uncharacterized membrane protein YfcA
MEIAALVFVAVGAGALGSMLGLGGGVILVPVLSLAFGVKLQSAIAASAISVVANSVSGSQAYLRLRYTNIRLALVLVTATAAGALAGGLLVVSLPTGLLRGIFATFLLAISILMLARRTASARAAPGPVRAEDPFVLEGRYADGPSSTVVQYVPRRLRAGLLGSSLAGVMSGLFGIGGGPITVPLMTLVMRMPLKAAASTSGFMVGLTASVSAFVYYNAGFVDPSVTVPVLCGIIVGARGGVRVATRLRPDILGRLFIGVMLALSALMFLDAFGVL